MQGIYMTLKVVEESRTLFEDEDTRSLHLAVFSLIQIVGLGKLYDDVCLGVQIVYIGCG